MKQFVPGKGSGGAGSKHAGQSKHNEGGQGSAKKSMHGYGGPSSAPSVTDTCMPKDNSKKSPKIFG